MAEHGTVEHALVVPFPGLVDLVGVANDLPPHVTILYPAPGDVAAIAEVLAPFPQLEVTFARLDRFPGTLWLAPEPAEAFAAMTAALAGRFPDHPPYGGVFKAVVPHLTVAQELLDETAELVEPLLPLHSHVETVVLYVSADGVHWHEHTTFDL